MKSIHQNAQSFSITRGLLNSSIFLSRFPKCDDHCQNKANGQIHLKTCMAPKPAWCVRVWPRKQDHLGFTLSKVFSFFVYISFLRFKAKAMCCLSENLVHLRDSYSRRKCDPATQHTAEESVTKVSKEDRNIWGCKAIRWHGLGAGKTLERL